MTFVTRTRAVVCFAAAFAAAFSAMASAQEIDPLSLRVTNLGYDSEKSTAVIAEEFAGLWDISISEDGGEQMEGTVSISVDWNTAFLDIEGPDGIEHYMSVEAEGLVFAEDTGPFSRALTIRFERVRPAGAGTETGAGERPLTVPFHLESITFRWQTGKDEDGVETSFERSFPLTWADAGRERLRIELHGREDRDRLDGVWSEERSGALKGGGKTQWTRVRSEEASRQPELKSIEIIKSDSLEPLDGKEIAVGESFRVRLTYGEDPGADFTEEVTITTSAGDSKVLKVTGEGREFVSEPVLVDPDVQP